MRHHLGRARVDQPIIVSAMSGTLDVLRPGDYYLDESGTSVRLRTDPGGINAVAEVKMPAFDYLLAQRQVVFLSWHSCVRNRGLLGRLRGRVQPSMAVSLRRS
jgi:hypothetical protein